MATWLSGRKVPFQDQASPTITRGPSKPPSSTPATWRRTRAGGEAVRVNENENDVLANVVLTNTILIACSPMTASPVGFVREFAKALTGKCHLPRRSSSLARK